MKFKAIFKSEYSGKITETILEMPEDIPERIVRMLAEAEAKKLEKKSYPPWKLIEVVKIEHAEEKHRRDILRRAGYGVNDGLERIK